MRCTEFVQGREEEDERDAVRNKRKRQEQAAAAPGDERGGRGDQPGVTGKVKEARPVGRLGTEIGGCGSGHALKYGSA